MPYNTYREQWDALSREPLSEDTQLALDALERVLATLQDAQGARALLQGAARVFSRSSNGSTDVNARENAAMRFHINATTESALLHVINYFDFQGRSIAAGDMPDLAEQYAGIQRDYLAGSPASTQQDA